MTVPFQPRPVALKVGELAGVTAIFRRWSPGDAARCRLCDVCAARDDACLLLTSARLEPHELPLFGGKLACDAPPPVEQPAPGAGQTWRDRPPLL
ncbi:MAG: hypothetical protein ACXWN0_10595 [Isosphaeraceae bacterium]